MRMKRSSLCLRLDQVSHQAESSANRTAVRNKVCVSWQLLHSEEAQVVVARPNQLKPFFVSNPGLLTYRAISACFCATQSACLIGSVL